MAARIINEGRLDRNGIIHTTSYKRRNQWMTWVEDNPSRSGYLGPRVISHRATSSSARDAVTSLKSSTGKILASPSLTTGYDFKYKHAEYQIILKVPHPDTRSKVMKRRVKEDPEYGPNVTSKLLMQMTGRIVRDEEDQGETFITDDSITWWLRKWKHLMKQWWLQAYIDWEYTVGWDNGRLPHAPPTLAIRKRTNGNGN
jgi:Rad3-related DNA helicase